MFKSFLYAVAFFVGIAFVAFAVAEPVDEMTPPVPKPNQSAPFTYNWCMELEPFVARMNDAGGKLLSSGWIPGKIISVLLFEDNSFGVFIYDPKIGVVCNINIGVFVPLTTLGRLI